MTFYENLALDVDAGPSRREGEAGCAVGEASLAAERVRDEWPPGRRNEPRRRPARRRARVHVGRSTRSPPSASFVAPRAFVALALCCSRTRRCCAASSSARRATASPGTSCSRCSQRPPCSGSHDGSARDEGHACAPDARHRRLGAAPAHAAAGSRGARHRAGLRRARRPRVGRRRLLRRAARAGGADPGAARRRSAAPRARSPDAARGRRAHPPRARRPLRRPRRTLRGAQLVSTKHNDDPFRIGAFRFVERGLARLADRVVTITDALARFTVERVGVPAERSRRSTTGSTSCRRPGATTRPTTCPTARGFCSRSRA